MARQKALLLAVCALFIAWLARDAWANGGDQCTGSINAAGVMSCTSNNCANDGCASTGWQPVSGGVSEWQWNGTAWVLVQTYGHGQAETESCACNGVTSTCCRTVKIKDGAGFKYGTYGGCVDDCDPPMHDPCKPSGTPLGNVAAACRP